MSDGGIPNASASRIETKESGEALANRRVLLMLCIGSAFVVLLAQTYFSRNKFFSVDDSFITFTYTKNLLQGYGPVFNVGERYFGTTALGYSLVLTAAYRAASAVESSLTIQNVSVLLSAASLAGTALMLLWASRAALRRTAVIFPLFLCVAIYTFTGGPFNEVAGHETYPFLAAALAATLLAGFRHPFAAGVILAVAVTLRPDAMLFAPIIGLGLLMRGKDSRTPWRKRELARFSLGFVALALPWLGWTTYYYGRPIPGTLEAKRSHVLLGYWPHYDLDAVFSYLSSHGDLLLLCAFFILAAYSIASVVASEGLRGGLERSPMLFAVICWALFCILSVAFYCAADVTFWEWYGIPIIFSLMVCGFGSAVVLCESPSKGRGQVVLRIVVPLVVVITVADYGRITTWFTTDNVKQHLSAYFETADFLRAAEPAGAVVETAEPGSLAFRLGPKFRVVDELGLITPGVSAARLNGDNTYANRTHRPDYIVCSWPGKYSACYHDEVMADYRLVGSFDREFWEPRLGRGALLFKRID